MNACGDKLAGKIAVVTGASRGIGRAIAALFARHGATVAGCHVGFAGDGFLADVDVDVDVANGRKSFLVTCDVRRADAVKRFADRVLSDLGPPDVLVNNAGTVARRAFALLDEETWDDVISSNLKSTYLVTRAFLPALRGTGRARIINIASIAGHQGTAMLTAYCAAKHAVVGLTRALAEELRPDGIPVNAISPGSVDTDMLQIGMPGGVAKMTAAQIADVALYLATDAPPAQTGSCVEVFG